MDPEKRPPHTVFQNHYKRSNFTSKSIDFSLSKNFIVIEGILLNFQMSYFLGILVQFELV